MRSSTKNVRLGDNTIIGGTLTITGTLDVASNATVKGLVSQPLSAATPSALGGVKQAAAQANSTASDAAGLLADFNALLAKLRAAGILASS